jgi:hypothetical protein
MLTVSYPGATSTYPNGNNNRGEIVGNYADSGGVFHGRQLIFPAHTTRLYTVSITWAKSWATITSQLRPSNTGSLVIVGPRKVLSNFQPRAGRQGVVAMPSLLGDDELRGARHIYFAEGRKIRKAETVVVLHLDGHNAAGIINFSLAPGQARNIAASCGRPRDGHTQSAGSARGTPPRYRAAPTSALETPDENAEPYPERTSVGSLLRFRLYAITSAKLLTQLRSVFRVARIIWRASVSMRRLTEKL